MTDRTMTDREIIAYFQADPETDSTDILIALIATHEGGSVTKHDLVRLGKLKVLCAHRHISRLADRGHFVRIPRTAPNGADMPTIYKLAPADRQPPAHECS